MKKIPQLSDRPDDDAPETGPDGAPPKAPADGSSDAPDVPGASRAPDGTTVSDASDGVSALDVVKDALPGRTANAGRAGADDAPLASSLDADPEPGHGAPAGAAHGSPAGREGRAGRSAPSGRKKKSTARGPARRFARERALQALYQWDVADAESSTVRREFIERQDMSRVDVDYFERLFRGISHDVEKVDATLVDALDRPFGEVDPIERAVLRIAAFELAEVLETPARVVINEGVEITKRFGADNGHRYVNAVLDKLAATLRPLEMRRG